jgi:hypothetical protein
MQCPSIFFIRMELNVHKMNSLFSSTNQHWYCHCSVELK